jgi:hypothetical protein
MFSVDLECCGMVTRAIASLHRGMDFSRFRCLGIRCFAQFTAQRLAYGLSIVSQSLSVREEILLEVMMTMGVVVVVVT